MKKTITKNKKDDVVIPHQNQIRVFINHVNSISIEMKSDIDGDPIIAFNPLHAKEICNAILKCAADIDLMQ